MSKKTKKEIAEYQFKYQSRYYQENKKEITEKQAEYRKKRNKNKYLTGSY